MSTQTKNKRIRAVLRHIGYSNGKKITETLQGSIWKAESSHHRSVVMKVTNCDLHEHKLAVINNRTYSVDEDILMEKSILKFLTQNKQCPDSIVKFLRFFKTNTEYYLLMENGGTSLFEFIKKAHALISKGQIPLTEWHKMVRIIFNQMIESVEYIHSKNVCHFDISLENFLINDVQIVVEQQETLKASTTQISFVTEDVRVKMCDFGLAGLFTKSPCLSKKYCGKENYKSPEVMKKKKFDAKKNDIWCLGVCLFMMLFGSAPFHKAHKTDSAFRKLMDGDLVQLLRGWDKLDEVDQDLIDLLNGLFQYESSRIDLNEMKRNKWLNYN